MFKGRYYPRSSIEESSIGYAPSFAWRSILSARDLIHKGAQWRIGNGEKVLVCKDKWISYHIGFKIQGPERGLGLDAKVSYLIRNELGHWKGT